MPKIRIEYEVPEDCLKCDVSVNTPFQDIRRCKLFSIFVLCGKDGKFQRCQPCIEAEVKEGE